MILLLALACDKGPDFYDIDTWNSPLALEFDGVGDATEGARIYVEEHWEDASPYALTCISCHHNDSADTLLDDSDEYNRPAHTTYNAAWRGRWKANQNWDEEESNILGAYGGQVCVTAYFPEGSAMTAEQAAHLEAYMRTLRDATEDEADDRSQPLDYAFQSWDTGEDFLASVASGSSWLYGTDLGDPAAGEALATEYCGTCHTASGDSTPSFYTTGSLSLQTLTQRIRKYKVGETAAPNDRMPGVREDKLVDEDLRDLLAYLTQGREGE